MKTEHSTATFSNDETRWNALLSRDSSADGEFFYAVRTTGVFFRPSCASRQPRRDNVEFFDTPSKPKLPVIGRAIGVSRAACRASWLLWSGRARRSTPTRSNA